MGTFYNKSSFGFWGLHRTTKTNVKVNPQRKKPLLVLILRPTNQPSCPLWTLKYFSSSETF